MQRKDALCLSLSIGLTLPLAIEPFLVLSVMLILLSEFGLPEFRLKMPEKESPFSFSSAVL